MYKVICLTVDVAPSKSLSTASQCLARLLDMVELGIDRYRSIKDFRAAAATVQVGNKVCTDYSRCAIT